MSELQKKYLKALSVVKNPERDGLNPHFKNPYATLNACMDAAKEACAQAGIGFRFEVYTYPNDEEAVCTVVFDEDEEKQVAPVKLKGCTDMQKEGSAITYAKRYSLCMAFAVVGEDDDDGNMASQPQKVYRGKQQGPRPSQQRQMQPNQQPRQTQQANALASAKQELNHAIERWAQAYGSDVQACKAGIAKRPDYEANKGNPEWFLDVAEEFIGAVDGAISVA